MDLEKLGQKVVMDKIEDMVEDGVKKFIGGGAEGQKDDKGFNIDSVFGGGKSDDKGFNVGDVLSMVTPKDEGNGGGIAKALGGLFD